MEPLRAPSPDLDDLEAQFKNISLHDLEGLHRDKLTRAVANVLATDIAELTYAQIVDGLPLGPVARDSYDGGFCLRDGHPLFTQHTELCPGVLERTRQFKSDFDIGSLYFDSRRIAQYQSAAPGSTAFHTRLIELVAISVHQIAVRLFKIDTSLHKDDAIAAWTPPKENISFWYHYKGPPQTLFRHPWYLNYEKYPEGVADGVGYWAEARILGGVVLFDRLESHKGGQPNAIYFHSDRKRVTYRAYKLLDEQKKQLLDFLLSESSAPTQNCPIPISGTAENRQRVDPEEPVERTKIYRDRWERKPLTLEDGDRRLKDVADLFNYSSVRDWREASFRGGFLKQELLDQYLQEHGEESD